MNTFQYKTKYLLMDFSTTPSRNQGKFSTARMDLSEQQVVLVTSTTTLPDEDEKVPCNTNLLLGYIGLLNCQYAE
jgi:hypothetical protein